LLPVRKRADSTTACKAGGLHFRPASENAKMHISVELATGCQAIGLNGKHQDADLKGITIGMATFDLQKET
jgi:hypothetical protein